jgi:hypothetical protein
MRASERRTPHPGVMAEVATKRNADYAGRRWHRALPIRVHCRVSLHLQSVIWRLGFRLMLQWKGIWCG